jgi:hypothetical protein
MMKRQPNGTWRSTRQPIVVSAEILRARWVEAETFRLKCIGLPSFEAIADQISRVGRGQAQPMVAIPDGVTFPLDYKITRQACHKAFRKAIAREPALELAEFRKLDTMRCEEMLMNLQPGIRKGNARAIEVGVKVLDHEAKINNYGPQGRRPETAVQTNVSVEPPKSRDELHKEAAMKCNLLYEAVKILVELGVPLPQLNPPAVETTATPAQEPEKKEQNTDDVPS